MTLYTNSLLTSISSHFSVPDDYSQDPLAWFQSRFKDPTQHHLWSIQQQILNSIVNNPLTAVQSCHSSGKSFTAARAVAWWITSHPPGSAFVVTSAPTGDQVKAILWREIRAAANRSTPPLLAPQDKMNLTEWFINGELCAIGRKPNEYEPTAFQGVHARYCLVVLDEACGIPRTLWDAASTLTSNEHGRILAIGNPDDPHSHFARVCNLPSWNVIKISAFDTPNFTGEEVPLVLKDGLISPRWVAEKAEEWGESSALYTSKVLGEFPGDSEDGIIPNSYLSQCRRADIQEEPTSRTVLHAGLDVGAGGDRSVLWTRINNTALRRREMRSSDPVALASFVTRALLEDQPTNHSPVLIRVDSNGVGWGVCGMLRSSLAAATIRAKVMPVNVSTRSRYPERLANLRAELWWEVGRERSRRTQWDLSAISDSDAAELCEPRYRIMSKGRIIVEPKAEVRKRLGRSPDSADALLLAFYDPPRTNPAQVSASEHLHRAGAGFQAPTAYDGRSYSTASRRG